MTTSITSPLYVVNQRLPVTLYKNNTIDVTNDCHNDVVIQLESLRFRPLLKSSRRAMCVFHPKTAGISTACRACTRWGIALSVYIWPDYWSPSFFE